ncbi:hypothetical protein LTR94_027677 [Friedmanniomyces endolithicus]|nr:hypothetical protein LTR94_027677 [Friedmanniomyces endolithicus]
MSVCCGGILGMGESRADRIGFLHALASLPTPPDSVPLNALVPIAGTPLGDMLAGTPMARIDELEFVRTVAVARILMPQSMALCYMAGANSIFTGDRLLTTCNNGSDADAELFAKLGISTDL